MRFSKSVLAVSLLVALQGAHAQGSIINEDKVFNEATEIKVTTSSSGNADNYIGIEASNGSYVIDMIDGAVLSIIGNQSTIENAKEIQGILVSENSSLSFKGNSSFDLKAKDAILRGIRLDKGNLSMTGSHKLNLRSESTTSLFAIDVRNGGKLEAIDSDLLVTAESDTATIWGFYANAGEIAFNGSVKLDLKSDKGIIVGVNAAGDTKSQIDISGSEFVLNAQSNSGQLLAVQAYKTLGSTINFNSANTLIHLDNTNANQMNRAVFVNGGTVNFRGDTTIELYGNTGGTFGINLEGDSNSAFGSVVNFEGSKTNIYVEGKNVEKHTIAISSSGPKSKVLINSEEVTLVAKSTGNKAYGVNVQYGSTLEITNKNATVNISAQVEAGEARAISNSVYGNGTNDQFGSVIIKAKNVNLTAKGINAFGVISALEPGKGVKTKNKNAGVHIEAKTTIQTISDGGKSIGILTTNKDDADPSHKVSITDLTVSSLAQNGGSAFAVYLNDSGKLEVGNGKFMATSEGGKAVGIYNNNGSIVKFTGDSVVQAETALQGNGTVNVETGAVLTLDGKIIKDEWTGIINANGKVAYGVAESIAVSDLANATDGTLLVIAGTEIAGNINVGSVAGNSTATSNSLKVASDGTVLVRATESYDGTSPLIKVDSVGAEKGSRVHLLNAAAVAEGTKVFESNDADEDSLEDYLFTTDNFLKKVENNRIVGEKSANVFGSDLLIPNVVDAAVNATNNEGADRILGLTNKALTQAQSLKAIHQIALMVPASGAQSTAINVANLQLDVIDTHASKLALHAEDKVGADLWIDLNGFLSKTNDYSAGSTKFGYKSDLAGVTIGSDYSFGNGYAAGVSVAFGKGSVRGQSEGSGVKNDVDYYGVNLYGVWSNDYFNTIGSAGYLRTKNEIKTQGFKGKPDAKTVSVGVRFEKPLALNESITVTPHLGVRYKHVKLDSFNAGGFKYTTEKADIVELPFGVAFNANLKAPCGADVKPFVDLTIAPNFGDRKVSNKIALAGTTASDSFDARIANNAMYNAKVGVNAVKGSHTFGLNYGIGGGNRGRVDQTLQARYTYRF